MLHEALKAVRKFHHFGVGETANEIGVSISYLSELENGKKRIHSDILEAYSRVFNIPVSAIYLIAENLDGSSKNGSGVIARKIAQIIKWIADD